MKKLAIALALVLAFAPLGMAYFSPDDSESVSNSITTSSTITATGVISTSTNLVIVPAASAAIASGATAGSIKIINDADALGNCSSTAALGSGGSNQVVCVSDGTNWIPLSGTLS